MARARHRRRHGARLELLQPDRKSTRLNSSHGYISYAVFCLKKKKTGYWIMDTGYWILDTGYWKLKVFKYSTVFGYTEASIQYQQLVSSTLVILEEISLLWCL